MPNIIGYQLILDRVHDFLVVVKSIVGLVVVVVVVVVVVIVVTPTVVTVGALADSNSQVHIEFFVVEVQRAVDNGEVDSDLGVVTVVTKVTVVMCAIAIGISIVTVANN